MRGAAQDGGSRSGQSALNKTGVTDKRLFGHVGLQPPSAPIDQVICGPSMPAPKGALPDSQNSPATDEQGIPNTCVSGDISFDLRPPEISVGSGPREQMTSMAVPEATVDEYDGPVLGEHQIGTPGQVTGMQTISEPLGKQGLSDQNFRLGIPTTNA